MKSEIVLSKENCKKFEKVTITIVGFLFILLLVWAITFTTLSVFIVVFYAFIVALLALIIGTLTYESKLVYSKSEKRLTIKKSALLKLSDKIIEISDSSFISLEKEIVQIKQQEVEFFPVMLTTEGKMTGLRFSGQFEDNHRFGVETAKLIGVSFKNKISNCV